MIATLLLIMASAVSHADNALFFGPQMGSTSYSSTSGDGSRNSQSSYGADLYFKHDFWMGGITYSTYSAPETGTGSVSVGQSNLWFESEVRYVFMATPFSPFVGLGAGVLFQTVSTQLYGTKEEYEETFFTRHAGIGILGRFMENFGLSLSVKYYETANRNGFNYAISLGYFPIL